MTVFPRGQDHGYALAGLTRLSDGRLIADAYGYQLLNEEGLADFGGGTSDFHNPEVAWSDDGGRTWSAPQKVRIAPMRLAAVRDGVVEMPNGNLLMPLCGLRSRHGLPELGGGETFVAFVVASTDGGRQWHYWGTMAYDPLDIRSYWEPALLHLRDGRLLGMIRAPQWAGRYRSGGYLFMTVSEDGGAGWSEPKQTELFAYGNPPDLIQLSNGRVLCTYGRRQDPMGVFLAVSDDGLTWDGSNEIVLRNYRIPEDPPVRGSGFPYHIGYPTSVELDGGEILTAYHLFNEEGRQYVEAAIYSLE